MFNDFKNLALIKACCVPWAYLASRIFRGSPNILRQSSFCNEVMAKKYILNIKASMCRGIFRTSSLASSIVCCNVGAWTILTKGFTFTKNVCHRRKMWTGFGCIELRSFEDPWPMRRDSGLGKNPPSFDSSSEEPCKDSFTSPISSLRFSHKVLGRLADDKWNW
jgi:hypothetical protein